MPVWVNDSQATNLDVVLGWNTAILPIWVAHSLKNVPTIQLLSLAAPAGVGVEDFLSFQCNQMSCDLLLSGTTIGEVEWKGMCLFGLVLQKSRKGGTGHSFPQGEVQVMEDMPRNTAIFEKKVQLLMNKAAIFS